MGWRLSWLLALAMLWPCAPLSAQPATDSEASGASASFADHYQQAMGLYKAEKFTEAIAEFEAAYAVQKDPKLLINIGRAYHKLRRPKEAIAHYERYLKEDPSPDAAVAARVRAYIEEAKALPGGAAAEPAQLPATPQRTPKSSETGAAGSPTPTLPAATAGKSAEPTASSPLALSGGAKDQPEGGTGKKPIYKRWWFWTGIGVVAAAAIIIPVAVVSTQSAGPTGYPDGLDVRMVRF